MIRTILERIAVPFEYAVTFTRGALDEHNHELVDAIASREPRKRHRVAAAIDSGVVDAWPRIEERLAAYAAAHADRIELVGPPAIVPGGERCKNDPALLGSLVRWMGRHHLDRRSVVLAIGGGAVLDMTGFAAATVRGGLRLVRVPTTVLSQADSSVRVMNGVNAFDRKNALGTFAPPFAVVIDTSFLSTLDPRDSAAGMAEAVKIGLVRDASFYHWIRESASALARRSTGALEALVQRSAELHLEHLTTSGDPFEHEAPRPLDFGHWAAERLELMTQDRLRHGEAVAIGMAIDASYAAEMGLAPASTARSLLATLSALGLGPSYTDGALDERDAGGRLALLGGVEDFRESLGGELRVVLVTEPGETIVVNRIDPGRMERAILGLRAREAA